MNRTCPDCGGFNPPESLACGCGRRLQLARSKPAIPLYLAALPLIVPAFFMFKAMAPDSAGASSLRASSCVETFDVTLSGGEKPAILRGMVRNKCAGPIEKVKLRIVTEGEDGTASEAAIEIGGLVPGVPQAFERSWGTRVKSWKITADQ